MGWGERTHDEEPNREDPASCGACRPDRACAFHEGFAAGWRAAAEAALGALASTT